MPVYMIQAGGDWGPVKIGYGYPIIDRHPIPLADRGHPAPKSACFLPANCAGGL